MNQGGNINMNNFFNESKLARFPYELFDDKPHKDSVYSETSDSSELDSIAPKSLKVKQRLEALIEILGKNYSIKGNDYIWACPYCREEGADTDGDHFKFNINKNKYNCFRSEDHKSAISEQLKEKIKNKKEENGESKTIEENPIPESEPQAVDTSQFKSLSNQELLETLGLTIKHDEVNKLITFYPMLLAYTESSQMNISYSAPSCTGKSYIPTEEGQLFPEKDVIEVGYCSSTAFFHDNGNYNKETNTIIINFAGIILIFLDQPHTQLLQHLRPLLSHDKKEILVKITDKSQKGGHRTKNVLLTGYPTVIFCTAGLNIDEQEATRFILLSPETSCEKIRAGVNEKIDKEADKTAYKRWLEENPQRILLKERILAIKQEKVKDIKIGDPKKLKELFFNKYGNSLKPRHQRDIGKIISLIKGRTLLNLWFREKEGSTLITSDDDIEQGFNLWCEVSESQELNLPPFVYKLYQEIILPAYEQKGSGIERNEVLKKHFKVYGRPLSEKSFRLEIIPMLENAGLIYQEEDKDDRRKRLIYPTTSSTISSNQNNSVNGGRVTNSSTNNSSSNGGVDDIDSLFNPVKKQEE